MLPLPTANARDLSLENHLALATMRSGYGTFHHLVCLLKVVYLAYFIGEVRGVQAELAQLHAAERVLRREMTRVQAQQQCRWTDAELGVLAPVLALHDKQLSLVPKHRLEAALETLKRAVRGTQKSPLPPQHSGLCA